MSGLFNLPTAKETVRKPAVAGQFYPGNADQLKHEVERFIAGGKTLPVPVRMLIIPHAGYVFSGPVAGKAYAVLDQKVRTVILIGPSHHAMFEGLAVPEAGGFETPLGIVPCDTDRIKKLLASPLVHKNSKAHGPEHCLEVQLPFLQVRLAKCKIVPILTGRIQPKQAVDLILPLIDDQTAVIASSDLSHYLNQEKARATDDRTIATIMAGNDTGFIDACGELPIRILSIIARHSGFTPTLLDARTSYDTYPRYGSQDKVVGYASIAYLPSATAATTVREESVKPAEGITPEIKTFLLSLARQSLNAAVRGEKPPLPGTVPPSAKEDAGCFVTLTVNGDLRGCIGYIEPIKPLYLAVIDNAKNAALSDPRFPKVTPSELSSIKIEVSVLTKPSSLEYKNPDDLLNKLVPDKDGVILKKGPYQSTYLPQVWEHFSGNKVRFLENLSLKAGMPADGWKTSTVKRYRAEHFSE